MNLTHFEFCVSFNNFFFLHASKWFACHDFSYNQTTATRARPQFGANSVTYACSAKVKWICIMANYKITIIIVCISVKKISILFSGTRRISPKAIDARTDMRCNFSYSVCQEVVQILHMLQLLISFSVAFFFYTEHV